MTQPTRGQHSDVSYFRERVECLQRQLATLKAELIIEMRNLAEAEEASHGR